MWVLCYETDNVRQMGCTKVYSLLSLQTSIAQVYSAYVQHVSWLEQYIPAVIKVLINYFLQHNKLTITG